MINEELFTIIVFSPFIIITFDFLVSIFLEEFFGVLYFPGDLLHFFFDKITLLFNKLRSIKLRNPNLINLIKLIILKIVDIVLDIIIWIRDKIGLNEIFRWL